MGVAAPAPVPRCCDCPGGDACAVVRRYTGEMGVLAVIPLVAFFGFDVLNKDDFNSFLWNVVMLAMGGLALGGAGRGCGTKGLVLLSQPQPDGFWCWCADGTRHHAWPPTRNDKTLHFVVY